MKKCTFVSPSESDKVNENEEKLGVVNLCRIGGGQVHPDLGGQYHRILQ